MSGAAGKARDAASQARQIVIQQAGDGAGEWIDRALTIAMVGGGLLLAYLLFKPLMMAGRAVGVGLSVVDDGLDGAEGLLDGMFGPLD